MSIKKYGLFGNINNNLSTNKVIRKELTYQDIEHHYNCGDIIIPEFQRDIDNEKIDEIKTELENDNMYLINCTNPIQLATMQIDSDKWIHYVIDGQHRLNSILSLTQKIPNSYQTFVLHLCKREKDAIKIFEKLIKGQEKNYLLSDESLKDNYRSSKIFLTKEYFKKYYSDHFSDSEKNKNLYTLDGFLNELKIRGFFDLPKLKNEKKVREFIFKKLKKFSKKINYETLVDTQPKLFNKKDIVLLKETNFQCLGLKNCNFVDYIMTTKEKKITPIHNFKTLKDSISQQLKKEVWTYYYNNRIKKQCPITNCKKMITSTKFSTGHIISEKNNGSLEIENLHPICVSCNSKMGSKNWKDFDLLSFKNIEKFQESNNL